MKFIVRWTETFSALVEAADEAEAIRKVKNDEVELTTIETSYGHEAEAQGGE